jgi:hypothetical protein
MYKYRLVSAVIVWGVYQDCLRFAAVAARPPQRLGHSAALHSHAVAPAQFVGPVFAMQTLIRAAKTSHTAGTLCVIFAKKFSEKALTK